MSDHEDDQAPHSPSAEEAPNALADTTNPDRTANDGDGDVQPDEAFGASGTSASGFVGGEAHGEGDEDGGEAASTSKQTAEELKDLIAGNDVKNIILQVTSPYLDDNGRMDDDDDGADGEGDNLGDDGDSSAQRYDHIKSKMWIQLICDGIMERLVALSKPYKFIVHCMIMRKNGAGMHVCSSCVYGHQDGWVNHAHDLSTHVYAIVTVYWSAI